MFFFTDTPTTEIYTLSLHDALPISAKSSGVTTSTAITGSSNTGEALRAASLNAIDPAILNAISRSEEHTSELQSQSNLVCRLLLEKKKETELPHRRRLNLLPEHEHL